MPLSNTPAIALAALVSLAGCRADVAPGGAQAQAGPASAPSASAEHARLLARGEYLVRIAGCNDCHTAGYAQRLGEVPGDAWLAGSPVGYSGPWGTTYAVNLRSRLAAMDEAQWLTYSANLRTRPVMPDFALRAMSEDDRRAIYRFVRMLGPAEGEAPAYLAPGIKPAPPYFVLVEPPAAAPAGTR